MKQKLEAARGIIKAPLVLKNGFVVDVFTGRILRTDVAISGDTILGIGEYAGEVEVNCSGQYITPGLINCHCHIESTMVTPETYSIWETIWGTTTIIADPHEIANVSGTVGLDYMLSFCDRLPVNCYYQLPSCVPATPFEDNGAEISAKSFLPYLNHKHILGLGELMNVSGTLEYDQTVWDKLHLFENRVIDGHGPGLSGKDLNGYILSGVSTDHESSSYEEALEKLSKGMAILVREGSACKNLESIIKGVVAEDISTTNMAFCTDDKHLGHIVEEGTIAQCVRKSIVLGLSPVKAIQMATINGARIYGLKHMGGIAAGYRSDLVVWDSLETMNPVKVFKDGELICENRMYNKEVIDYSPLPFALANSVVLPPLCATDFAVPEKEIYPVIQMVEGEILTKLVYYTPEEIRCKGSEIATIAVIERHGGKGTMGIGYIEGYGLREGAFATTVAHDSHNLLVVGQSSADMLEAALQIEELQGGFAYVKNNIVEAELSLAIGGLMTREIPEYIEEDIAYMVSILRMNGVKENIDPLVTLSFMALPVIPEVRLTNRGMFDVVKGKFLSE